MTKRRLPIGIQTFRQIREEGCYAWFAAAGFDVAVEDGTSRGRLDMALRFGGAVYLFEFKVVEQSEPGAALAQIRKRGYAEKHRAPGRAVHLVGVEFSSATRNIVAFDVERDEAPAAPRSPEESA